MPGMRSTALVRRATSRRRSTRHGHGLHSTPLTRWIILIEIADMVTMQAAQRLIGVNVLRREALADAARHGRVLTDVVERSVRLEIAAALRITENEAAAMLAMSEALVERYPTVLDSFAARPDDGAARSGPGRGRPDGGTGVP